MAASSPIPLNDRRLWGNEAADDEDPRVLDSYFVRQSEWADFFDDRVPISIVRAKKGMGKSALIRECAFKVQQEQRALVISVKGWDLVAQKEFRSKVPLEQVNDWQQRICALIARHLGASIGVALTDDKVSLIEAAELAGFKERNLVGLIVDRLKGRIGLGSLNLDTTKLEIADNKALLERVFNRQEVPVWLLVDDIDATFGGTAEEIQRLATFFSACRELAANYRGLVLRISVRTDVWAVIRRADEALDKPDQYIFDIDWSQKEFRRLLSERILSYVRRESPKGHAFDGGDRPMDLVFESRFRWGKGKTDPDRVIHTLAARRPRWAMQLCRLAGHEAVSVGANRIKWGHVDQILDRYGRNRLDDLSREYRNQCQAIGSVLNAFATHESVYKTGDLLAAIERDILEHVEVSVDGRSRVGAIEIARFLFRIGFLLARDVREDSVKYFHFEERDRLLENRANLDDGMDWYIHPAFHRVLSLRQTAP